MTAAAHRTKRPWQGAQETQEGNTLPEYDDKCYLCPGNKRAGGTLTNDKYESTFVRCVWTHQMLHWMRAGRCARRIADLLVVLHYNKQIFENDFAALKPDKVAPIPAGTGEWLRSAVVVAVVSCDR